MSSSGAKLWEEGGLRGVEKGEGAAGSGTTSRGGSQVFFVLPLWTGHCRERKEHLLALTSLGTVSEQRKSTIQDANGG